MDSVKEIILIEPSLIAIKRATLHIQKLAPAIPVRTICKSFDDLTKDYFKPEPGDWNVHLFSNVLDLDNYSQQLLFDLIENTQTGRNYFVCVSPYITSVHTERLNTFKRYFEKNHSYAFHSLLEVDSQKDIRDPYWLCNMNKNNRIKRHGINPYCGNYTNEGGCGKKWTRVIRVFKVEWESI
ncbi:MAG: hypothetical protein LUH15_15945 [Tannerellaceae bacterium]|nr:hypothetical protein [Tannerellaceae bacterium]